MVVLCRVCSEGAAIVDKIDTLTEHVLRWALQAAGATPV